MSLLVGTLFSSSYALKLKENDATFFKSIDDDGDGVIRRDEIRNFVKYIGTNDFDEQQEIENGVQLILSNVDSNFDKVLSISDLDLYWKRLGVLLTVEETARWAEHSIQIPQLGQVFREHSVAGQDIPTILVKEKEMKELGIPPAYQRALRRSIAMKLMGLGRAPSPIESFVWSSQACRRISLRWKKPLHDGGVPVHKYVLERRSSLSSNPKIWEKIAEGVDLFYHDEEVSGDGTYSYRLEAWNAIGHSEYAIVEDADLNSCQSSVYQMYIGLLAYQEVSTMSQLVFIVLLLILFFISQGPVCCLLRDFLDSYLPFESKFENQVEDNLEKRSNRPNCINSDDNLYSDINNNSCSSSGSSSKWWGTKSKSVEDIVIMPSSKNQEDLLSKAIEYKQLPVDKCNYCFRKFGTTLFRHHCSQCTAVFCNRDGYTPHFMLSDCGIPGNCICIKCIMEQSQELDTARENGDIRQRIGRTMENQDDEEIIISPSQRKATDLWRKMRLIVNASNGFRHPSLTDRVISSSKGPDGITRLNIHSSRGLKIFSKLKGK